jgi:hypothetical protein
VTFAFIEAEKADFPISFMCDRLDVSTSGFYEWRHAQTHPCARRVEDAELLDRIVEIHRMSRRSYGSPRVHDELVLGEGRRVGRKRIERLMRVNGIGDPQTPPGLHPPGSRRDPQRRSGEPSVHR